MAFTKTWIGTTGDYELVTNWQKISLVNPAYAWTQVGATAEWYVRTAAAGDPGFAATPPASGGVYINGSVATQGTITSLAAGEWAYGDPDTLGYNTITVRITGDGDPDSQDADYVEFRQIPQAGENVRIPASGGSISSNLDQRAVAINGFYVEDGYDGTIAASTGFLRIDPNIFEFNSLGQAYIDLHTAAITATVHSTGVGDTGEHGLYLRGSALSLVDVRGGSVGIAAQAGETSTVTTLRISDSSARVFCGSGLSLTSVVPIFEGTLWLNCSATTITKYGGNVYLGEAAAVTTVNDLGPGEFHYGSSGNITTYHARGSGLLNMRASNAARTLTTLNIYTTSGNVIYNKEAVTITNHTFNDSVNATYSA